MEPKKIFVGNLSFNLSDDQVKEIFANYGSIVEFYRNPDKKGFCFITLETEEMANKAVEEKNGFNADGREISVSIAKKREERSDYNRNDGGNRGGNRNGGYRN